MISCSVARLLQLLSFMFVCRQLYFSPVHMPVFCFWTLELGELLQELGVARGPLVHPIDCRHFHPRSRAGGDGR
jgi:hypothetical protein